MIIVRMTDGKMETQSIRYGLKEMIHRADIVISNGIIVKHRNEKRGGKIGDAIFIWDEKELT